MVQIKNKICGLSSLNTVSDERRVTGLPLLITDMIQQHEQEEPVSWTQPICSQSNSGILSRWLSYLSRPCFQCRNTVRWARMKRRARLFSSLVEQITHPDLRWTPRTPFKMEKPTGPFSRAMLKSPNAREHWPWPGVGHTWNPGNKLEGTVEHHLGKQMKAARRSSTRPIGMSATHLITFIPTQKQKNVVAWYNY